jgi:hypothetical protein
MPETPIISSLKLPFQFDEKKLVHDLNQISNIEWTSMLYTQNYKGEWNSIALYAPDGDTNTPFVDNITTNLTPTSAIENCYYFKDVITHFKSSLLSVRLLRLTPGSIIKPHEDYKLGYEDDNFRIHIPITTNKDVSFILRGDKLTMNPGDCWYTNVNFTHSVSNHGKTDRVHLVIDLERNEWSDKLFFSLAPKESFALSDNIYSKEVLIQMISELEMNSSPAAKELVNTYREELIKMS